MKKIKIRPFPINSFIGLFIILMLISVFSRFMMMDAAKMVEDTSKQQMIALATAASLLVTAEDLNEFIIASDMEKEEYRLLKEKLIKFTDEAHIDFTYFLRLDTETNMMQFIIDNTETNYTALAEPQVDRENAPDIALSGIANAVPIGNYSEGWEGYLTAFAPVYYSDGTLSNIVAGVDMHDMYINQARNSISNISLIFIASVFIFLVVQLIVVIKLITKNSELDQVLATKTTTLATVSASIPDMVFTLDADLCYTSCNHSFEEYVGANESHIIGKNDFELFISKKHNYYSIIETNKKVLSTKQSMMTEDVLIYPDKSKRYVETLRTPLMQNGQVIGLLGISRDITERLESIQEIESRNKLIDTVNLVARTLLSSTTEDFEALVHGGLAILGEETNVDRVYIWRNWTDDDGRLHCRQIFEWSPNVKPQQGTDYTNDIIYDIDAPSWEKLLSNRRAVKGLVRDMPASEQEGLIAQGITSLLVVPITIDDRFWGFMGFDDCHNEREFTDMEENILTACGHMIVSGIIKNEMTLNLIIAKEEAQAASIAKTQFLAVMSHEIRTPLNAIIGLSEIQLRNDLPDATCVDLEKIHSSGSSLLGIINDILDISKIEAGGFILVPMEYSTPSLINDTMQLNLVRIGSKPITFEVSLSETLPSKLYGDEMRVKQILNNLLSNAFKYTMGGTVKLVVDWELCGESSTLLTVSVIDSGIGIKKEDMDSLFMDYNQLDIKANRKIEGTGLGLSITRRLLEMMDGTITVESEYGKGTTFTAKFKQEIIDIKPIGAITVAKLKSFQFMTDRRATVKNLVHAYMPYGKVLIVDDVITNLDVAKGLMLPYGLKIDCVTSGKEAIELIKEEKIHYDLIFMDHMMPEMDGMETVRIIREEIGTEYAKAVPIIALTANALSGYEEMFCESGFNAFISKPIDIIRLDTTLNQWIRNKRNPQAPRQAKNDNIEKPKISLLNNEAINGIDLNAGIQRYGNETIYLEILRSFTKHTPKLLADLEYVTEENLSQYAVAVHGLKGSSFGILANELGRKAEALEFLSKSEDLEAVIEGNNELLKSAGSLILELEALFEKIANSTENIQIAPSPDKELLNSMLEASKMFKTSEMDDIMLELTQYQYESGGEIVDLLKEQLDNLEYDEIQAYLEEIL